jgi:hypothetical protein
VQRVQFTEDFQKCLFGKTMTGDSPPLKKEDGTRQRYATASLDLPSLSQKLLTCSMSIKKHSGCQWPTQNSCLFVSVTCLSSRIWDACQNHQAGKVAVRPKCLGHVKMDSYSFPQPNTKFSHKYLGLIKATLNC